MRFIKLDFVAREKSDDSFVLRHVSFIDNILSAIR